jgi:tetratricopeptide (TPR) repeat protein
LSGLVILLLLAPPGASEAYQQGTAAANAGRLVEAAAAFARAAELEPGNAQYWKALGVVYAKGGDYRSSIEPFTKACALNERLLDACYYQGRGLYAVDRYAEALAPLEKALKNDAVKSRAEAALGQALEALGRYDEAEKRLKSAITRLDAHDAQARVAYSQFLRRQGRPAESCEVLQAAKAAGGEEFYFELGLALFQAERYTDALKALEKASGHPEAAQLRDRARRRLAAQ